MPDPSFASRVPDPLRRYRPPVPRLLRPSEPVLLALPKAGLTGSNRRRKTAAGPPLPARGFCTRYPPAGAQRRVKGRDSRVFTLGFTSAFPWAEGRNDEESMTFRPVRRPSGTIQNTTPGTGATPLPAGLGRPEAPCSCRHSGGSLRWRVLPSPHTHRRTRRPTRKEPHAQTCSSSIEKKWKKTTVTLDREPRLGTERVAPATPWERTVHGASVASPPWPTLCAWSSAKTQSSCPFCGGGPEQEGLLGEKPTRSESVTETGTAHAIGNEPSSQAARRGTATAAATRTAPGWG